MEERAPHASVASGHRDEDAVGTRSMEGPEVGRRGDRRGVAAVLWPVAIITYLHMVVVGLDRPVIGDYQIIYEGAANFVDGLPVYVTPGYVFTPSGLLLTSWMGLLDPAAARVVLTVGSAVLAPVAGAAGLHLMGRSWRGPLGAGVLLALAVSETVSVTILLGNINIYIGALLVAALALMVRGRGLGAGVVLGLALALKPVMVLLVLLPLLRRQWSGVAAAVAVPAVLNVLGLLLVTSPGQLFSVTVPYLLTPREAPNSSLWAAGAFLGLDPGVVLVLRLVVVVAAVVVLWRVQGEPDLRLWVGVASGTLLLATFLGAALAEMYWSILLLPFLLTVVRPDSPLHSWVAWVGVYLFTTTHLWRWGSWPELGAFVTQLRPTLGWALVLCVVVVWAVRRPRPVR